jgi:hypothetical protein
MFGVLLPGIRNICKTYECNVEFCGVIPHITYKNKHTALDINLLEGNMLDEDYAKINNYVIQICRELKSG